MAIEKTKEKLALGSSLIVGVLSSLCCLGPIVALSLGLGSFGLSAFFESLRPYLLVVTALLLGAAFYFTYRGNTVSCEGGVCHKKGGSAVLWIVTGLVMLSAAFPYYSGLFVSKNPQNTVIAKSVTDSDTASKKVTFNVEGMTCAGCVINVENTLKKHQGVKSVAVTLEPSRAVVVYEPGKVEPVQLIEAINELGYKASLTGGGL